MTPESVALHLFRVMALFFHLLICILKWGFGVLGFWWCECVFDVWCRCVDECKLWNE